jgi:hypothetical protein
MSFPFKAGDVIFRNWNGQRRFPTPDIDNLFLILEVLPGNSGISSSAFARLLDPHGRVFSARITGELWNRVEP